MLHRRWKGGFTRLHRCNATGIDQLLRIAGEIHANVTQALLAAAGVINLFGVDADRFAEAACIVAVIAANRTRAANFFSSLSFIPGRRAYWSRSARNSNDASVFISWR